MTGRFQTEIASGSDSRLWAIEAVGDSHLVTVEGDAVTRSLCLYEVTADRMTLLDSHLELDVARSPVADRHGYIYVPHYGGVAVLRMVDNRRLHVDRNLTGGGSLKFVGSVAVVNDTTLCVRKRWGGDQSVSLLDITTDTLLTVLQQPAGTESKTAATVASVLGSVLVKYSDKTTATMVIYPAGNTSGTVLDIEGLKSVWYMTVDPAGRFLLSDRDGKTISVLAVTGEVLARFESDWTGELIHSPDNSRLYTRNTWTGEITVLQ